MNRKNTLPYIKWALNSMHEDLSLLYYPFDWADIFSLSLIISYYKANGTTPKIEFSNENAKKVAVRMGIKNFLDVNFEDHRTYHDSTGRFIEFKNFRTEEEVFNLGGEIVELLRKTELREDDVRSLGWIIPELMDNVINHACSPVGGYVCGMVYKTMGYVEFAIVDSGIGFKGSFQKRFGNLSEREAVRRAVLEKDDAGTSDEKRGGGRGLPVSWEILKKAGGELLILTGHYAFNNGEILPIWDDNNWQGVAIRFTFPYGKIGYNDLYELLGTPEDILPPIYQRSGSIEEDDIFDMI